MKICIAGKNSIAINAMDYLIKQLKIDKSNLIILTNKNDTGIDGWQKSFKKYAIDNQIKISRLEDLYDIDDLIFISLEYDKIINTKLFKSKKLYNIHFSKLPQYKGMYTSTWPIINGEKYTGVTLHKIDNGIDTGDIIKQVEFEIDIKYTCRDLYFKYLQYGFELFKENIESILKDDISTEYQSCIESSYYSSKSIDYDNIIIDLNKTAFEIYNQIRAFIFKEYQLPVIDKYKIKSVELVNYKLDQNEKLKINNNDIFIKGIDGYGVIAKKS